MKKLLLALIYTSIISCNSQNCEDIPNVFTTYEELISTINNTTFKLEDSVDTSKSSWIRKANYYSCDNRVGFLVLEKDKENYIFENVPVSVWNRFKNADSFGKFYHSNIKNKYHLHLN